uniref:Uncharacterized protein n=1 Tax=Magallana gigas TaxID=29159 RepID=K1QYJ6_MAGGI
MLSYILTSGGLLKFRDLIFKCLSLAHRFLHICGVHWSCLESAGGSGNGTIGVSAKCAADVCATSLRTGDKRVCNERSSPAHSAGERSEL